MSKKNHSSRAGAADPRVFKLAPLLILTVTVVISAVFGFYLYRLDLLPMRYFAIICIALVIANLVFFLLVRDFSVKVRCMIGLVISVIYCGLLIYGGHLLSITHNTINTVTTISTQVTEMTVYVRSDDAAEDIADTASYAYGIMSEQNRDITDKALESLNSDLGTSLMIREYDGPIALINALFSGDVDAILFSANYFNILADMEEYQNIAAMVRQLTSLSIETEVSAPTKEESQESSAEESSGSAEKNDRVLTVYITGIDTYGRISNTSRSDVNIIATINLDTHQVVLITTPRDYYIEFSNSNGRYDKLTHAGIYGVETSISTLEMLYDIDIDYFFRVNFSGFEDIVDAIGGITVNNDISFTAISGEYYPAGEVYLYGSYALAYVRERHAFSDGDLTRGRHQILVIRALIDKCLSPDILSNYASLLSAIEGNFETSIPYELISQIVKEQLENGDSWNIVSYSATGYNDFRTCWSLGEGAAVVTPYYETVDEAKELMRQVRDGEVVTLP